MFPKVMCVSLLASLFALSQISRADSYSYQTIDAPESSVTILYGINNLGQVVGHADGVFAGTSFGFLDAGGTFTTLPFDFPRGINDSGQILSYYGLVGANGQFTQLRTNLGNYYDGINNAGQIVGHYYCVIYEGTSCGEGGFLYSNGNFSRLNLPAPYVEPLAINNLGQIAGYFGTSGLAFIDTNGAFTTFATPARIAEITGLNDSGEIVGNAMGSGFVIANGVTTIIRFPGAQLTAVYGVNDAGQLVGAYDITSAGFSHGFIATPVPEPASLLVLVIGVVIGGLERVFHRSRIHRVTPSNLSVRQSVST
jgi:uncharacterized membrane protein